MNPTPDFDELVGSEPLGGERERLRRAHELLVEAGPPQELPPALARGPDSERSKAVRRRQVKRRAFVLLAAALAVAAVFSSGYAVGNRHSTDVAGLLGLKGTRAAPHARATLEILPATAGNWPMKLTVRDLPALPAHAYYDVYLVRKGERYLSCGRFVTAGGSAPFTVPLNAPYRLGPGDRWIVTRESPGSSDHGTTVLRPA
jgi:Anti-sigma-K factor rskA, C-terminal